MRHHPSGEKERRWCLAAWGDGSSMANPVLAYRNQGRWEEAEKLDAEVMETSKTKLGFGHPDALASMKKKPIKKLPSFHLEKSWSTCRRLGLHGRLHLGSAASSWSKASPHHIILSCCRQMEVEYHVRLGSKIPGT